MSEFFINLNNQRSYTNVLQKDIVENKIIAVVGLGYVGLPLAVAFAKNCCNVIGIDLNHHKINAYKKGIDVTNEVAEEDIQYLKNIHFTTEQKDLNKADFIIIAVPTPSKDHLPDLHILKNATKMVALNMKDSAIICYESTVYPSTTETVCLPILEMYHKNVKIGYSPERINPADKVHRLKNIVKIVSGIDKETKEFLTALYSIVVDNVYPVSCIKVAESAKVFENNQRDINIAYMNELALICNKLNIETNEVLTAMNTKWNALKFQPGLPGGHCIPEDSYYIIQKAKDLGVHPHIMESARNLNESMPKWIVQQVIHKMVLNKLDFSKTKVALFGITFKENCNDIRNSRAEDIYHILKDEYNLIVDVIDPVADKEQVKKELNIDLVDETKDNDVLIFFNKHEQFTKFDVDTLYSFSTGIKPILIDIKSIFTNYKDKFTYWSL